MKTLILCGGKGTRAYPHTVDVPKPLLEVAGIPVLRHVMEIYAAQGHRDFILAAGYRRELVEDFAAGVPADWTVEVVDTGEETNTGDRIARCRHALEGDTFVTYADGLGNVDLAELYDFHQRHGGDATVTIVPLRSQYATIEYDEDDRVVRFAEKPTLPETWVNAGFFVIGESAFDRWHGEDLERDVLPGLSRVGRLFAYRHLGFWRSMDTYKDSLELSALYVDGAGPWTVSG